MKKFVLFVFVLALALLASAVQAHEASHGHATAAFANAVISLNVDDEVSVAGPSWLCTAERHPHVLQVHFYRDWGTRHITGAHTDGHSSYAGPGRKWTWNASAYNIHIHLWRTDTGRPQRIESWRC